MKDNSVGGSERCPECKSPFDDPFQFCNACPPESFLPDGVTYNGRTLGTGSD